MWKHATAFFGLAFLSAVLATFGFQPAGVAAEAVFTRDGQCIFFLNIPRPTGAAAVTVLNVATAQTSPFLMPRAIQAHGHPIGLARSKSGFLLILFPDSLWAYDPEKQRPESAAGENNLRRLPPPQSSAGAWACAPLPSFLSR